MQTTQIRKVAYTFPRENKRLDVIVRLFLNEQFIEEARYNNCTVAWLGKLVFNDPTMEVKSGKEIEKPKKDGELSPSRGESQKKKRRDQAAVEGGSL